MSTYSDWRKAFLKRPEPRQVHWLCGPEAVLIEDIIRSIKWALSPEPWDYVPLVLGEDSEREVWAQLAQHPSGQGNRLVVVRNAEKLKQTERVTAFVKHWTENPRTYAVFVSNEESIRHTEPTQDRPKGEVIPFLRFGVKGYVIEAKPFTQRTVPVAIEWVKSKAKMRDGVASYLLDRANGNLRLARDTSLKLAAFGGEASMSAVNELLSEMPRDTFSDALVAIDKKTALLALERLTPSEYSRTLGMLDQRLDLAGMVHDLMLEHKTASEIARAAGNKNFLVPEIMKVAKHYDSKRRLEIRQVLALADETLRSGEHVGVLEVVVSQW